MDSDLRPDSDNASTWPRRASRACASCRRDKIRCDGVRPCGGCIKKGYPPDRCVDGCDPCRRARVRCEDGKPCQRCRDMQLECIEETTVHQTLPDTTLVSARSLRAATTDRAKLACTNCRRDNKKCDDHRPCTRCVTRNEECVHVGRGPKLVKLRCEACRQDSKRCEDARPCAYCVENNRQCVTQPRKGRGHGTRVKAACVTCRKVILHTVLAYLLIWDRNRRDKIRCDGVRPCSACVRKGLECVERACKSCLREGVVAECSHRKAQATSSSEVLEDAGPRQSYYRAPASLEREYSAYDEQPVHLPPISHPPHPPSHQTYDSPPHMGQMGHSHYYYQPPQNMVGPGQSPQSTLQPYVQGVQNQRRVAYYPAIDPNIDNDTRASGSGSYSRQDLKDDRTHE